MAGTIQAATIPNEILTVYAREAILQAQPMFIFKNFVEHKEQLGVEPGNTIRFLIMNNIAKGGRLPDEMTPVPRQTMTSSTVELRVYEFANSIQFTRFAATSSYRDLLEDAALQLGRDYALVIDEYLRDIYLATANVQWATGKTMDSQIAAGGVFNTAEIKDAVETLKTLNIPPVYRNGQGDYICAAHPHQLRTLRDDVFWREARQYVNPADMYAGEVGRYEGVVFIETTQMPITPGVGSGGIDIYSAIMFGDRAVGYAETVPLELVTDGFKDFGRFIDIGYYTVAGAGIVNDFILEIRTA